MRHPLLYWSIASSQQSIGETLTVSDKTLEFYRAVLAFGVVLTVVSKVQYSAEKIDTYSKLLQYRATAGPSIVLLRVLHSQ